MHHWWTPATAVPTTMESWISRVLVAAVVITLITSLLAWSAAASLSAQIRHDTSARENYQDAAKARGCLLLQGQASVPGSSISVVELREVGC